MAFGNNRNLQLLQNEGVATILVARMKIKIPVIFPIIAGVDSNEGKQIRQMVPMVNETHNGMPTSINSHLFLSLCKIRLCIK
jgi:hypothetical protein